MGINIRDILLRSNSVFFFQTNGPINPANALYHVPNCVHLTMHVEKRMTNNFCVKFI